MNTAQDVIDRASEWVGEHYPEATGAEWDQRLTDAVADIEAIDALTTDPTEEYRPLSHHVVLELNTSVADGLVYATLTVGGNVRYSDGWYPREEAVRLALATRIEQVTEAHALGLLDAGERDERLAATRAAATRLGVAL